ncbi:MAG: branched-chain amino acid ABC transporter permease [Actinobacteria bacterium]|jgi:branched-chain amino acid transport system permease protein|nr:branched-chain amino acid ABC transporter permease [Actinomycetota bacterium]
MTAFVEYLMTGIARGLVFALLAMGFVFIYRVTRVVNFAQGAFAVFGGFITYSLLRAGVPQGVSELLAILAAALIGLIFGIITIAGDLPLLASLIITIGLSILSEAILMLIWGTTPITYSGLTGHDFVILGAFIQRQYLIVVLASLALFALVALAFGRTYFGKAMTACASNPYAAKLSGINVKRMGLVAFMLGGALGGAAGVLITPLSPMTYDADVSLAITGFAAAIVGGLTSPGLAVIGGLVFGLAEQFVAGYWSPSNETAVALALLIILLLWQARRMRLEGLE